MSQKILIATRNAHKLEEIRAMLPGLTLIGTDAYPNVPDPEENGTTFEANAILKAEAWSAATGLPAIADDSGLEVDALDGAPGIHSARYAGNHGDTAANNAKLIAALQDVPQAERTARFVCALAYSQPGQPTQTLRGTCEGTIISNLRGTGGFGYDPLFIPVGHNDTFAALDPAIKATISHRARAFQAAREQWLTPTHTK